MTDRISVNILLFLITYIMYMDSNDVHDNITGEYVSYPSTQYLSHVTEEMNVLSFGGSIQVSVFSVQPT